MRQFLVTRLTGLFLKLQHRKQHQRDGLPVREVVPGAYAVGKSVYIARQLRVDCVTTIHRGLGHIEPRLLGLLLADSGRFRTQYGKVLQNEFHAFHRHLHVLRINLGVAHGPFDTMAQRVDTARCGHGLRRTDGQFAIVYHVHHLQPYQDGRALCPLIVRHHCPYRHFGTGAGSRRHHDQRQCLTRNGQELQQQRFHRHVRHPAPRGNHLATVHHRSAAQSDDGIRFHLQCLRATGFYDGYRRLGVDVAKERSVDACRIQRLQYRGIVTQVVQGLVGHYQHMLIARFLADSANLTTRAMPGSHLRLRQRNRVNHFPRQPVNLFSKVISIHSDYFFSYYS